MACHAENNTPTVGPDEVNLGRVKNWIRIERYWDGEYPDLEGALHPDHVPAVPARAV